MGKMGTSASCTLQPRDSWDGQMEGHPSPSKWMEK